MANPLLIFFSVDRQQGGWPAPGVQLAAGQEREPDRRRRRDEQAHVVRVQKHLHPRKMIAQ